MKNIFYLLIIITLLFSCKKSDIDVPTEDILKGKLKSMKVRDTSLGLDTIVNYIFEYDKLGKLQKMDDNDGLLYEWISADSDNLIVRYYDAEANTKDYLVKVENHIVKSITANSETIYEVQYTNGVISQAKISRNCFIGVYPILGSSSDFILSHFLKNSNEYTFDLDFTVYAFPPMSFHDEDIHIPFSIVKSDIETPIPLPFQGLSSVGIWLEGGRDVHEYKMIYFLELSGYHIWDYDKRLTENNQMFQFDYQINNLDQISEMQYGYDDVVSGRFEFEYY